MKDSRILIVEDDTTIQTYLQRKLESYGYRVVDTVASGEEAVQKTAEICPDLVIMDIGLEGRMDGVQAASVIRYRYNIPVVFLTANSDDETMVRVKDADPFGFIVKPAVDKDIYMTIELALFKHFQEIQLRENEQRYLEILNLAQCAIVAIDRNDCILFMNAEAERLLNMDFLALKGFNFFETFNLNAGYISRYTICALSYKDSGPLKVKILMSEHQNHDYMKVMVILPEK